jgi:hypothetical protein
MADARSIAKVDERLMEDGIISHEYKREYKIVHNMLNTYQKKTGGILTDENFKVGQEKLREWLMILNKKGASQEKLTSYLRSGLAHLSFDYISSKNRSLSMDELVTRTLLSFKGRNFHMSFFKIAPTKRGERITIKKGKNN